MASIYGSLAAVIKGAFGTVGLELSRASRNPSRTLLGMRQLPIHTIIDIGANTGQFAAHVSRIFPEAILFCFEPLAEPFTDLQRWAETQSGRVRVFNTALGAETGEAAMYRHVEHSASSSLLATTAVCNQLYPQTRAQDSVRIRLITLDAALDGQTLRPEILLKLDTQGYERQVIQGAANTLQKTRAVIIEINLLKLYDQQPSFIELVEMLDQFGFRYAGNLEQTCSPTGEVVYVDAVFLK
ncbi:MAG: FkbM family methyltransferase [Acidobacteria bacterium]|nr:FkbM family methyltransferase [Acidobacteriota bacterium]